jgi:hypothetical protein
MAAILLLSMTQMWTLRQTLYVRNIVARSRNRCYHGNETVRFLYIVVGINVTVNSITVFSVTIKKNNWFSLQWCQATEYFVLLLTTISIKYNECVSVFLSQPSGLQTALNIMSVCLYSCLSHQACKQHLSAPRCIVMCGLSACTVFFDIISSIICAFRIKYLT